MTGMDRKILIILNSWKKLIAYIQVNESSDRKTNKLMVVNEVNWD